MGLMNDTDIIAYTARLFERRNNFIMLERAEICIGAWKPKQNKCHENVSILCEHVPTYQPVRGWFYFDELIKFIPHSVIRRPNGEIRDITLSLVTAQYPFIIVEEPEAEYQALIERLGINHLYHFGLLINLHLWQLQAPLCGQSFSAAQKVHMGSRIATKSGIKTVLNDGTTESLVQHSQLAPEQTSAQAKRTTEH